MIFISRVLKSRLIRFLMAAFVCSFLFLSSGFPAIAATNAPTEANTNAEDALKEVQKESEEALRSGPRSLEEIQSKAKGAPNAVQGRADVEQMNRPENSQDSDSVEEKVKGFLDNLTGSN